MFPHSCAHIPGFSAKLLKRGFFRAEVDAVALAEGDKAPDFTLKATNGQEISLNSFKGAKNVLLVFYCRNNTPG